MLLLLLLALDVTDSLPVVKPDSAQVVVISPRVGPQIDPAERRSFHLFPGSDDFSSAVFYRMPDSTYAVELRTLFLPAGQRYPVAEEQFRRIGHYIDDFENIIPELASLPDGQSLYFDLWAGIGRIPERPFPAPRAAPGESEWTNRIINCASGAACGLGIGGTLGAISAIKFAETRQESVLTHGCWDGEGYWYHYSVDYYDLNAETYAAAAGAGTAAGGAAGWLVGQARDRRNLGNAVARRGIADYDFFGGPIAETEVQTHLLPQNRVGWTFLGATSGFVVGTGLGLVLTSIARGIIFRPTHWDSIIVRNDGFALDLPLIALSLDGILKGAHLGYRRGMQLDWKEAVEATKREHLRIRP
jgi:hypothetical protein